MADKILNGNSLELLKEIQSDSIDLIFADPPYFMRVEGVLKRPEGSDFSGCNDSWDSFASHDDYLAFSRAWLRECHRILKPNGSFWVIGSMQCIYAIGGIMQELGFWLINDVVWQKSNPTPNFLGTRLNNSHETLLWATKSKNSKYTFHYKSAKELNSDIEGFDKGVRKQLGSVWRLPVCSGAERLKDLEGNKLHSTQKPLSLLYRIIAISSNMGDLVLDPFAGTLTTAAAAKMLGRDYIVMEQNSEYIKYGKERLDSIEFIESDIARAAFDRVKKAKLLDLLQSGVLREEIIYLKGSEKKAMLRSDGKAVYLDEVCLDKGLCGESGADKLGGVAGICADRLNDMQSYDIHTLAAKLKGSSAKRLNGFMHWEVMRDNKRVLLDRLRS